MSLAVAIFLARQVFAYANFPFDADEANHALGGLQMAQALDDGDFGRFARHFYSRDFYPPGYDWIKALTFVVLGPSPVVARMVSVASLFLAVLVKPSECLIRPDEGLQVLFFHKFPCLHFS